MEWLIGYSIVAGLVLFGATYIEAREGGSDWSGVRWIALLWPLVIIMAVAAYLGDKHKDA
jgi:hypothetical protein